MAEWSPFRELCSTSMDLNGIEIKQTKLISLLRALVIPVFVQTTVFNFSWLPYIKILGIRVI